MLLHWKFNRLHLFILKRNSISMEKCVRVQKADHTLDIAPWKSKNTIDFPQRNRSAFSKFAFENETQNDNRAERVKEGASQKWGPQHKQKTRLLVNANDLYGLPIDSCRLLSSPLGLIIDWQGPFTLAKHSEKSPLVRPANTPQTHRKRTSNQHKQTN